MQVTLDPFNWNRRKLTKARTALDYFRWWKDEDGSARVPGLDGLDCRKLGWRSDSAIQYFTAAEALDAISPYLDPPARRLLDRGFRRVIAENPTDEFGTGDASEGHYWISASPRTTRSILRHAEATDVAHLVNLDRSLAVRESSPVSPASDAKLRRLLEENRRILEESLQTMIRQHLAVLRAAVSHEFGLLGHCG